MLDVQAHGSDRLNVLITDGGERWAVQLPRLLEPQGVRSIRVGSLPEATEAIEHERIHVAVVDLALPSGPVAEPSQPAVPRPVPGGLKLLQLMRRLEPTPPAVIVRGRLFDPRYDDRHLAEALKLDVFSVLDQPVRIEQMLEVLRRILERYYGGMWPRRNPGRDRPEA